MSKFKVGDKVREVKGSLGGISYVYTNNKSICEVIAVYDSRIEVKILDCWNERKIGQVYEVDPDRMELISENLEPVTKTSDYPKLIREELFHIDLGPEYDDIHLNRKQAEVIYKKLGEVLC